MMKIVSIAFACVSFATFAGEDIHEGVVAWLRADSDLNADGIVQTNEIVDALSPVYKPTIRPYGWLPGTTEGQAGDFRWTNDVVTVPYTKRTIPGANNYCFRQSVWANNSGSMPNTICLSDTASKITSNSWSFHLRFKWAGSFISSNTAQQYVLVAGKSTSDADGHGLTWAVQTDGKFVCWIGSSNFMSYNTNVTQIESNKWTDVVFVFNDGGNINLSVMQEGGSLVTKSVSCSDKKYRPAPTGKFIIGNDTNRTSWEYYLIGASAYQAFRGEINQFAVWDKALSADEVKRVLAWPCEDLVRAGIADGKADEFDGEGEVSTSAFDADCGWGAFGGGIAAGATKSVAFTVPMRFNGLPQLLRWRGAADSAEGTLELKANGTVIDTLGVSPSGWTVYSIPGAYFVAKEVTTLTLTRKDAGDGLVKTDAIVVGGSWQEGTVSNNQYENGNMGTTPETFYVPDGDFSHFRDHADNGWGMRLKFDVPAVVAGYYNYTVKMRTIFENARSNVRFVAYVNGVKTWSENRDYGSWYNREFKIPAAALKAGENDIFFVNEGDPSVALGYFSFDYIQMCVGKKKTGMVLVVK